MDRYQLGPDDYTTGYNLMVALLTGLRMLGTPVDPATVDQQRAVVAAEDLLAAIGVTTPANTHQ